MGWGKLWEFFKASMGPRLCRRGNRRAGLTRSYYMSASMGPRLCRRGNDAGAAGGNGKIDRLQWGHVFVDVEIFPSPAAATRQKVSFNGATSL